MGSDRGDLLRDVMLATGTTQTTLARTSGVHQPSISQFLSGSVEFSDEQLARLLSCMGFQLEVVRRPVAPELTRSERRSWLLHRALSARLSRETLADWLPTIDRNLRRLRDGVRGEPHIGNLGRWTDLIGDRDVIGLKRVMTGLDRQSIEMREVSPMGGLMTAEERTDVLSRSGDVGSAVL